MDFAGEKYTYISKNKMKKLQNLRNDIKQDNLLYCDINSVDVIKEESGYDESVKEIMEIESDTKNNSNQISLDTNKISSSRPNAFKDNKKQTYARSRSNSLEKNFDEELDNVYSCSDEDQEEEIEKMEPGQNSYINDNSEEKNSNIFSKIGKSIKNIFSSNKKKTTRHKYNKTINNKSDKEVLYKVSSLNRELNNDKKLEYEHEVDTNILSLKFEFLKDKFEFATGDPILCNCEAILNLHSALIPIENSNKSLWTCEFCGNKNEILIEKEEIPTSDCVDFFVQSSNQLNKGMKGLNYNDDQSLIFCFDVSGSMCVTTPITGKHQIKGDYFEKTKNDLLSSFSDGSDQFYSSSNRNVTYISRLQCLQAAIESNLNQMLKEAPNRKVGFVTFNNEVIAYGDGTKDPIKINGNNMNEYEVIKSIGEKHQNIIGTPIKESIPFLLKKIYSIEETGQTSLGPAVLMAISLIPGSSPGSRIILCTDGISNMGIGNMEGLSTVEDIDSMKAFYKSLGSIAKSKGVAIDLITFEDEQSNIDILMYMIEETGGEIIRVKPTEILNQFSNLLTNQIVATNVKVKVKLHKLMQYRNEDDTDSIKHNGSTLIKEIGNVTKDSEMYVEYSFKKSEEIAKYVDVDLEALKFVPFQSIIDYTNLNGDRCIRVITKQQQICMERDIVQKQANYDIISTNAIQKTSNLAKGGKYREAQSHALAWKKFIKNNAEDNINANRNYKVYSNNMGVFNNDMQEVQYIQLSQQEASKFI